MNIAILASGKGSELINLYYKGYNIRCVISDNNCLAIKLAERLGIPTYIITDKKKWERSYRIVVLLREYWITHVLLSGYMQLLSKPLLSEQFSGGIVNLHPSYLPAYKGKDPQQQVIDADEAETGVTLHYVDETVDGGQIIEQVRVPILVADTVETLSHRLQLVGSIVVENFLKESM